MKKQYAYFSAAIRDGAKLRPRAVGHLFLDGGSCAMGAGAEAMGHAYCQGVDRNDLSPFKFICNEIFAAFPYLDQARASCGECGECESLRLFEVIWHLNDRHEWSREGIAAWLYAEEEKLGFVTVLEAQDTCDTRDNNLSQHSPASLPEKVFV